VRRDIPKRSKGFVKLPLSIGLPCWIGGRAAALARALRRFVGAIKNRRGLSLLAELDDHRLADHGPKRSDVERAGPARTLLGGATSVLERCVDERAAIVGPSRSRGSPRT